MKKTILKALLFGLCVTQAAFSQENYNLIVEGFDWGPSVSKVVLEFTDQLSENIDYKEFTVEATRTSSRPDVVISPASGTREVIGSYISNAKGERASSGNYLTLILQVGPTLSIASPFQYSRGNFWVDYSLSIKNESLKTAWTKEKERFIPLVDSFDLSGTFEGKYSGKTIHFASYAPQTNEKKPLIVWLHGGGEGGTDPTIPLLGNRAANYASEEIQTLFGGAHVLVPQSPTRWMDSGTGTTRGDKDDIYFKDIKILIENYLKENPTADPQKVYVGGCSNGGYLSFKLLLEYPDFFAAGYISALAFWAENVSNEALERIKNKPIWFIHSKDDTTTAANSTAIPMYEKLMAIGASDTHLSLYDHVIDITGAYGGEDFHYPGHWSWIYSHANKSILDYNGKPVTESGIPVTIMQWMSRKSLE